MKTITIPRRGDIITVDLNPVRGHEQRGLRPALVLSHEDFSTKTGLAIICPITSRIKGSPFEVSVAGAQTTGVILIHQVRTIDLASRGARIVDQTEQFTVQEVLRRLKFIIE